ncbi:kinesin-like protein KIF11-B [Bacillus rossius redtenbacheri]|uniref:kinesin-like protein KIF11-B n=1 Tax=Bacillus rossius redtenbacheri TaxID=93214 RepID=UPI002FDE91F9
MEGKSVKDSQQVRVYVRVRPLSVSERRGRNESIVDCSGSKEVRVRDRSHVVKPKVFKFDQVFGPDSKQIDVYHSILNPMMDEVLSGYNCTVFAYGQTGSGKTFTMVGERSSDPTISWDVDPLSGLIPRALSHLFDKLANVQENYVVRVSYLELYNEELIDLLSKNDDVPKLKLFEDTSRKGGVIVQGLEEEKVSTKDEIYHILEKGSEKRQMAATLMNSQSSRSHTVFTITLCIKEILSDEEVIKTGRLNLVDLAGSENIGRSGSIEKRAREAGNINQSLLTLGRVITALTENAPHIPYRESKLTRLLQESLGGRTKTSIIATVSPALSNLDETLSTLEYAFRARKIVNRPEVNQKLTRKAAITDYTEEIEHLRRDLLCNREKSGVYLGYEDYMHMLTNLEMLQEENEHKLAKMAALNEELKAKEELCNMLSMKIDRKFEKKQELAGCLSEVVTECYEKGHLLEVHAEAERRLTEKIEVVKSVVDESSSHIYKLHDKLSQVGQVRNENIERCKNFKNDALQKLLNVENCSMELQATSDSFFTDLKTTISGNCEKRNQACQSLQQTMLSCVTELDNKKREFGPENSEFVKKIEEMGQQIVDCVQEAGSSAACEWQSYLERFDSAAKHIEDHVQAVQNETEPLKNLERWQFTMQSDISEKHETLQEMMKQYRDLDFQENMCLQRTLEDMIEQQLQMNKDVERLDAHLGEVERALRADAPCPEEPAALSEDLAALKTSILEAFGQQSEAYREQSELCVQQSNQFASQISGAVANIAPHLTVAMENVSYLASATSDIVKSNDALWNECTEQCQKEMGNIRECLCGGHQARIQHTETLSRLVEDKVSECTSVIGQQDADLVRMADYLYGSLDSQVDRLENKWSRKITLEIEQTKNVVEDFVCNGLCKEFLTGETPERKEFQYPRNMMPLSPDEHILERFRASEDYNPSDAAVEAEIVNSSLTESSSSGAMTAPSQSPLAKSLDKEEFGQQERAVSTNDIPSSSLSADLDRTTISEPVFHSQGNGKENRVGVCAKNKAANKHPKKAVKKILVSKN